MKKLLTALALSALALSASAAGDKMQMDPAMKEKCDQMMADKSGMKAMKEAGCPMAKKTAKKKGHDHAKMHKTM